MTTFNPQWYKGKPQVPHKIVQHHYCVVNTFPPHRGWIQKIVQIEGKEQVVMLCDEHRDIHFE